MKTEKELHALADYLLQQKEPIVESYKKEAKKIDSFASLMALSHEEFLNNIPEFITHLAKKLRNEEHKIKQLTKEHGVHRWKLDLDLRDVLDEWELLYNVLIDVMNRAKDSISVSADTLYLGSQQVSAAIYQGVKMSVNEYVISQEMEAKVRLADLESAIRDYDEQNALQGESLRQASHDLGSSVFLIQMNLSLLSKTELPEKARDIVEDISTASKSLVAMLRSLLSLFRLEAGNENIDIEAFDAAKLMEELLDNMKPLADKRKIELFANGPDTLPVRGDKMKVWRIAQNLAMNSLKYTEEGYVQISWNNQSQNRWLLKIKDTGPGLDSTNAAAFSNTGTNEHAAKRKNQKIHETPDEINMHSEGIGLSIVRRLCKLLSAVAEVKTESGKGTEFRIIFPMDYSDS